MKVEMCFNCDEPTGRCGRRDDSIYDLRGNGPYCEDCYEQTEEYRAEQLARAAKVQK